MANKISKRNNIIYNDVSDQRITYANQLTTKTWNDIINVLKTQANINATYLSTLHNWLIGSGDDDISLNTDKSFVKYIIDDFATYAWSRENFYTKNEVYTKDETYPKAKLYTTDEAIALGLIHITEYNEDTGEITIAYNSKLMDVSYDNTTGNLKFEFNDNGETTDKTFKISDRDLDNFVHRTGNESIEGIKTFKSHIYINATTPYIISQKQGYVGMRTVNENNNTVGQLAISASAPDTYEGQVIKGFCTGNDGEFYGFEFSKKGPFFTIGASTKELATKEYVDSLPRLTYEIVENLPEGENISLSTIYLIKSTFIEDDNTYVEYMYANGKWEVIGTTAVDMTNYVDIHTSQTVGGVKTFTDGLVINSKQDTTSDSTVDTSTYYGDCIYTTYNNGQTDVNNKLLFPRKSGTIATEQYVQDMAKLNMQIVDELPTENISSSTIYLMAEGEGENITYTQYVYLDGAWRALGKIDLSDFYTKDEVDTGFVSKTGGEIVGHTTTPLSISTTNSQSNLLKFTVNANGTKKESSIGINSTGTPVIYTDKVYEIATRTDLVSAVEVVNDRLNKLIAGENDLHAKTAGYADEAGNAETLNGLSSDSFLKQTDTTLFVTNAGTNALQGDIIPLPQPDPDNVTNTIPTVVNLGSEQYPFEDIYAKRLYGYLDGSVTYAETAGVANALADGVKIPFINIDMTGVILEANKAANADNAYKLGNQDPSYYAKASSLDNYLNRTATGDKQINGGIVPETANSGYIGSFDKPFAHMYANRFIGDVYKDAAVPILQHKYDDTVNPSDSIHLGMSDGATYIYSNNDLYHKRANITEPARILDTYNIGGYSLSLLGTDALQGDIIPQVRGLQLGSVDYPFTLVVADSFKGNLIGNADTATNADNATKLNGVAATEYALRSHLWDYVTIKAAEETLMPLSNDLLYLKKSGGEMTGTIKPIAQGATNLGEEGRSFSKVYGVTFIGHLQGNADTATTATSANTATSAESANRANYATEADWASKDGAGNVITSTYYNKTQCDNRYLSKADAESTYLKISQRGVAGGVASLGTDGRVPSTQLPSYVDDVIEFTGGFPSGGETGKIYVDTNTNKTYRWGGTSYVEISQSLALGTTSSTAYRGDLGAANATAISALQLNVQGVKDRVLALENSSGSVDYASVAGALKEGTTTYTASSFALASSLSSYLPKSGGTLSGELTTQSIKPGSNNTYNLGTQNLVYNNVYANNFKGTADKAKADGDGKTISTTYWKKDNLKFELSGSTLKITTNE